MDNFSGIVPRTSPSSHHVGLYESTFRYTAIGLCSGWGSCGDHIEIFKYDLISGSYSLGCKLHGYQNYVSYLGLCFPVTARTCSLSCGTWCHSLGNLHQQNYKKLFALLGLLAAFPVADKSKQVHSTTNLETVKSHDSPHLIYDFPISLRH